MCPVTLHLLSCLVQLLTSHAVKGSGCGVDVRGLYDMVWSHSKFIHVMCQSCDVDEEDFSAYTLKGKAL